MSRPVLSNLGLVLQISGMLMILPIILGFHFSETEALISYFVTTIIFFSIGFLFNTFSQREDLDLISSAILITSVFFILGLIGSIPYLYLGVFDGSPLESFTNSYFESLAGYTTSGFSLIENVDALPQSLVFYRSLTQWIGGIGIVFIILAFFYPRGETTQGLGRALGLGRIIAGLRLVLSHVLIVYAIYAAVFIGLIYLFGFTDLLHSAALMLSSFATGGFSPVTDFASFTSGPIFFFVIVATFLGALNFFIHDKIVLGKIRGLFKTEFVVFVIIIAIGVFAFFYTSGMSLSDSVFHVFAASTTSGYATQDIGGLSEVSKFILMALMFVGGMTFSTAGGLKVLRLIMFFKSVPWVIGKMVHGERAHLTYEKERIDQGDAHIFMILPGLVLALLFISVFVFMLHGFSMSSALFESVSAYSLTGFSTGAVGVGTAASLKWWMILVFVIGRVEIIAFLLAFTRRNHEKEKSD